MRFIVVAAVLVLGLGAAAVLALQDRGEEERDPGSGPQDVARVDVGVITTVPDRWFRENVLVTGVAVPVDDERFVLRDGDDAIVVNPRPNTVQGEVEEGERVTVYGTVFGFGRLQIAELERLLEQDSTPEALRDAPTELESPYLQASEVRAQG